MGWGHGLVCKRVKVFLISKLGVWGDAGPPNPHAINSLCSRKEEPGWNPVESGMEQSTPFLPGPSNFLLYEPGVFTILRMYPLFLVHQAFKFGHKTYFCEAQLPQGNLRPLSLRACTNQLISWALARELPAGASFPATTPWLSRASKAHQADWLLP